MLFFVRRKIPLIICKFIILNMNNILQLHKSRININVMIDIDRYRLFDFSSWIFQRLVISLNIVTIRCEFKARDL